MVLYFSHLCAGFIVGAFFYTFLLPVLLFLAASVAIALLVSGPDAWVLQPVMALLGYALGFLLVLSLRRPRLFTWCLLFTDSIFFFVGLIELLAWVLVLLAAEAVANPWGALLCMLLWIILAVVCYELARFYTGMQTDSTFYREMNDASLAEATTAAAKNNTEPAPKYVHQNKHYASVLYFWTCFMLVVPLAGIWAIVQAVGLWEFFSSLIALACGVLVVLYTFLCLRAPVERVSVSSIGVVFSTQSSPSCGFGGDAS